MSPHDAASDSEPQMPATAAATTVTEVPSAAQKKRPMPTRRKRNLLWLTGLFAVAALVWLLMYLLFWRHEQSTDDAYVGGHVVQITPQVSGTVDSVLVEDTDTVQAGQVLVSLDDNDAQLAFERAKNELISAVRQNQQQTAGVRQSGAQVLLQKANLAKALADLKRRESIAGTDAISTEELSHARAAVEAAKAGLNAATAQEQASRAAIGNEALTDQPAVQMAMTRIKDAWLNLQRTQVRAPVAGQIARRNVQVGQKVAPGAVLMTVVPLQDVWVDANFKESQLSRMRIGQPVSVEADLYGGKVTYAGTVQGMSAGTGSAFSLLPPQNATGNWIKVVQRVPVRIRLDPKQVAEHPLRIGLSMKVTVDTARQEGEQLAAAPVKAPQKTAALTPDLAEADKLIAEILARYTRP